MISINYNPKHKPIEYYSYDLMSNCIKSIHTWLSNNSLSLNPNKTETIFLHPSPRRPLTVPPFIMVNNHNILYSDNVKYLGVYFDSSLSFHRHISNLLRSKLSSSLFPYNP